MSSNFKMLERAACEGRASARSGSNERMVNRCTLWDWRLRTRQASYAYSRQSIATSASGARAD